MHVKKVIPKEVLLVFILAMALKFVLRTTKQVPLGVEP